MEIKTNSPNNKGKGAVFFFLFWWMVWGIGAYYFMNTRGIDSLHAGWGALISIFLLAGISWVILSNMKYYLPGKEKYLYVVVVCLAMSGLWLLIAYIIETNVFKNDPVFLLMYKADLGLHFVIAFLLLACVTLAGLLRQTAQREADEVNYKQETERIAKDAELNKLRLKLQPHFLFNSLNSISALTGTQPEKARLMIQQLAAFLRGTLRKEDEGFISIEEELEQLKLYLDIEKLRFGHRLSVEINCEATLFKMQLPALLLQPVVENAIKFGLYDTIDEVSITINVIHSNNALVVTVQNPFDETTSITAKGTGFGLSSIRRRLFLLFGRQDLLQTKTAAGNFITLITIPQKI